MIWGRWEVTVWHQIGAYPWCEPIDIRRCGRWPWRWLAFVVGYIAVELDFVNMFFVGAIKVDRVRP